MCQAKPAPRCSGHAKTALEKATRSGNPEAIRVATEDYLHSPAGIEKLKEKGQLDVARKYELERAELLAQSKAVTTVRHNIQQGHHFEAGISHAGNSNAPTLPPVGYNTEVTLRPDPETGRFNALVRLTPPEVGTKEFDAGMQEHLFSHSKEGRNLDVQSGDLPDTSTLTREIFSRLIEEANERASFITSGYTAGDVYSTSPETATRKESLAEYQALKAEVDDAKEDGFNARPEDYQRLDELKSSLLNKESETRSMFDPALKAVSFKAEPYFTEGRVAQHVNTGLTKVMAEYSEDADVHEWVAKHPLASRANRVRAQAMIDRET